MRLRLTGPLFGLTLRGMLVITTLLAVGMAFIGTKVKQARDEKAIAAEILRAGGRVRYEHYGIDSSTAQNSRTWFEQWIDLDLESHVINATLSGPTVTDDTIAHLAGLPQLRYLLLNNTNVSGTGLAKLAQLQSLRTLWISGNTTDPLTDEALAAIARLPALTVLSMQKHDAQSTRQPGAVLGPDALTPLARMPALTQLELSGPGFRDEHFRQLPQHKRLFTLSLTGTGVSDAGLAGIAVAMPELRSLRITSCPLTGVNFACLRSCQNLNSLSLYQCAITDDDVAGIAQLDELRFLTMSRDFQLTDEALRHIGVMTNLTWLDVQGAWFTDNGAQHLVGLTSLTQLSLNSKTGKFTDAGPFIAIKNLTNLALGPQGLPASTAQQLQANMPRTVYSSLRAPR
ncbi:MAG TPA: hypothetical protein VGN12_02060 [Pirellulales bacterium]|jgi:Leucine-rich repeat (LRR) protein